MSREALAATVAAVTLAALPLAVHAESFVYARGKSADVPAELVLFYPNSPVASDGSPIVIDLAGSAVRDPEALAARGVSVVVMFYWDDWPGGEPLTTPMLARAQAEAVACAVRFVRGFESRSDTAPLVPTGFSFHAGLASHVALAGESFDRVWEEHAESKGGPPALFDCTAGEVSAKVDGFVGVAGPYDALMGQDGRYVPDFTLEHVPDVLDVLDATDHRHADLRVRLLHGVADPVVPLEASIALGALLAAAGYDVEVVEFDGDHAVPSELVVQAILDLVS